MKKFAIIAAAWLVAITVIVVLFATERIEWPEVWLLAVTFAATACAAYFAPRHRWWWIAGSSLIAFVVGTVAWMVVFASLSHFSERSAESWLTDQFNGASLVPPDEATCVTTADGKCSFVAIANRHGGAANVDCYDNIPFAILGWECRAKFRDGTSIYFDAWSTWVKRSAHISDDAR